MTTDRPPNGRTTLHDDGTVTLWDWLAQCWRRADRFDRRLFEPMSNDERCRVLRHLGGRG